MVIKIFNIIKYKYILVLLLSTSLKYIQLYKVTIIRTFVGSVAYKDVINIIIIAQNKKG